MKVKLVKRKNPQNKTTEKFYANPVNAGLKTLRDVSRDIAGRSSLTRGDIENVLLNFVDQLPGYLRDGFSIQLSEFGTLRLSLGSTGSETEKAFNTATIRPRLIFTPGVSVKRALQETNYEVVREKESNGGSPSSPGSPETPNP